MKILLKIIFIILISLSTFSINTPAGFADDTENLKTGEGVKDIEHENDYINDMKNDNDFGVETGGEKGIRLMIIRIARDLKNLFLIIAGVYFLIIVIKLLMSSKTDEEVTNFKKGIIRISLGIMTTQIAFYFVQILFDEEINYTLAGNFVANIIEPLIKLLETMTGFFFLAIMIYAFYRIITAGGDEEKAKSGKMSVLYAGIGFVVIKISTTLVESIYGSIYSSGFAGVEYGTTNDVSGFASIVVKIINWMNGFVGIAVVLMITYAGFLSLTSFGEEEKLKKAKNIIMYVAIGMLVLVSNYLILTFFINNV